MVRKAKTAGCGLRRGVKEYKSSFENIRVQKL